MPYLGNGVGFLSPAAEFLHMPINPLTAFGFFLKRHAKYESKLLLLNQNHNFSFSCPLYPFLGQGEGSGAYSCCI